MTKSRIRTLESHTRHNGFSFAEVMFAVVILGVGFIMVASIFPIAIEQTRSTTDEAVAAVLARDAIATIHKATTADDYIPTSMTQTFSNVWAKVSASAINQSDPRYAWIPFISKTSEGPYKISILVVRRWIHDSYQPADTGGALMPRNVSLSITDQPDGSQHLVITKDLTLEYYRCVATGSFLIISGGDTDAVGKVIRAGQFISSDTNSVSFAVEPNQGLESGDYCHTGSAQVLGKDWKNASDDTAGYDGPAQDVAVYTTFLNQN